MPCSILTCNYASLIDGMLICNDPDNQGGEMPCGRITMETMHLIGLEDVMKAGHNMQSAASDMQRALPPLKMPFICTSSSCPNGYMTSGH